MNKICGYFLVIFCAVLLGTIIIQDIISVIAQVNSKGSSIEFLEIPNGVYEDSILMISSFNGSETRDGLQVPFVSFCSCALMSFTNRSRFDQCTKVLQMPVPMPNVGITWVSFFGNSRNYRDRKVHLYKPISLKQELLDQS